MKTTLIQNIRFFAIAMTVASTLLLSCEETDYPEAQPSTTGFLTTARILVVNASNAAGITAFVENVAAGSTLAPGANSGYVPVSVSQDQVRIKGAGGTLGTGDVSAKSTFAPNTSYTFFVTDTITRPLVRNTATNAVTDPGGVRLLSLTDTLTAPASGTAKVRVFNLTPDVSTTSVRLLNTATNQGAAAFPGRAYRNVAAANLRYTTVPAGTYTAQVYTATTVPSATTAPAAATATVTLADGKIYTIYSQGLNRTKTLGVGTLLHN